MNDGIKIAATRKIKTTDLVRSKLNKPHRGRPTVLHFEELQFALQDNQSYRQAVNQHYALLGLLDFTRRSGEPQEKYIDENRIHYQGVFEQYGRIIYQDGNYGYEDNLNDLVNGILEVMQEGLTSREIEKRLRLARKIAKQE